MVAIGYSAGGRGWRRPAAGPDGGGRYAVLAAAASTTAAISVAAAGHTGWWAAAAAGAGPAVVAVTARIRAAYRAGRAAEQARWLRLLHDTALQSLEAMALVSDADREAPAETLTRLRAAARREAVALRGNLAELTGTTAPAADSLVGALAGVIAALPPEAPAVDLVGAEPDLELPAARRDALCHAARAALGNAVRHAAAGRIVVRVAEAGPGVAVVVRDDGIGFDPAGTGAGFGIRQSITARIREAGGDATVESWPGRGTRVHLWVPGGLTTRSLRRRPHR